MSAQSLARISNDFEPSPDAIPLGSYLTTREAAALLGITPSQTLHRARAWGVYAILVGEQQCYWTPQQVERLRGAP